MFSFYILFAVFFYDDVAIANSEIQEKPPPCFSDVYCHGPLLHTVQMAKLYKDSKTFVDMKLKASPNETIKQFDTFMELHNNNPDKAATRNFVDNNFEPHDQEFAKWIPKDWIESPKFLEKIKDLQLKNWAIDLHSIWKDLGRQIKDDVKENPDLYSLIWVPNPFIVPGGRFREFYYWDSYWIVQGLLLSNMKTTVKGMLENFVYIVDKYGHIPNGGRIYYLERSQPPFLSPMVKAYVDYTNDMNFIKLHIKQLDKEFKYWMSNHLKTFQYNGKNYSMTVYGDNSKGPRPESYHEDIETGNVFKTDDQKENFYSELKAAAESGWDFSSRWFISNETSSLNLTHTKTRSIIPVDLNAFIYWNAVILRGFHESLGNKAQTKYYDQKASQWMTAVNEVLYDKTNGAWFDFDLINMVRRKTFHPGNIVPLFTECYPKERKSDVVLRVLKYLRDNKLDEYQGGIPTTFEHTGEQWDFPNAWPPLQHMMIVGLNNTGDRYAQRYAKELAEKWIKSNYESYNATEAMFEKYDAISAGGQGGGGEYDVQLGFGWTNGVVLHLLNEYGQDIALYDDEIPINDGTHLDEIDGIHKEHIFITNSPSTFTQATTAIVCLVISLLLGYIGFSICKRTSVGWQYSQKKDSRPSRRQYTELRTMQDEVRSM